MVFGGFLNPGFRVDRAGEVHVQVSALGHAIEEGIERGRTLLTRLAESQSGARLRRRQLRQEGGGGREGKASGNQERDNTSDAI
jgi:hypothetical protein